MTHQFYYNSSVGRLRIVCSESHLLELHTGAEGGDECDGDVSALPDVCRVVSACIDDCFAGCRSLPPLPTAAARSEFQRAVWRELLAIPYGTTTTYGAIAARLAQKSGRRVAAQAVGGAVGRNPIAIVIPCHRVIGAEGNLTGYAGGLDVKIKLLDIECVDTSVLRMPTRR